MLLTNMIKFSRIFIYILSIVLLVSTIKTKNKKVCKNNRIISILFILYLYISISFLPNFAGIDQGLDALVILPNIILDTIILIVNITICSKKLKKSELKDENNSFLKLYFVILICLPIAFVMIPFSREILILNNANLVITFNYQSGIIISEDTRYVIGEKFCKEISISEEFINKPVEQQSEHYSYNIKYSEIGNGYSITSYNDPELNKIDTSVVEILYKDIEINGSEQKRHNAYIDKIDGTNYYIISHCISNNENESGGSVIAEYLYNGTTRIDSINVAGSIETINIYSH